MIALGLLLGTFSCSSQDPAPTLTGSVSYIYATSPAAGYPGEIGVDSTEVGPIRVYIYYGMPIHIRSSNTAGDLSSFAVGDRVIMHYDKNSAILKSGTPVWPVTDIEIDK
jgi:hypothetical protein